MGNCFSDQPAAGQNKRTEPSFSSNDDKGNVIILPSGKLPQTPKKLENKNRTSSSTTSASSIGSSSIKGNSSPSSKTSSPLSDSQIKLKPSSNSLAKPPPPPASSHRKSIGGNTLENSGSFKFANQPNSTNAFVEHKARRASNVNQSTPTHRKSVGPNNFEKIPASQLKRSPSTINSSRSNSFVENKSRRASSVVQNHDICKSCSEKINSKLDEAKDSKSTSFHKSCLKCSVCSNSLQNRERITTPTPNLTPSQYFVEMESNLYFCDKHNPQLARQRKFSIKGQNIQEKAVQDNELKQLAEERKEENIRGKQVLEESGGLFLSSEITCGRCGQAIEKKHKLVMNGLNKYHEICPTKDEIMNSNKTVRYFLKQLPERLVLLLTWDGWKSTRSTFLYLLDKTKLKEAFKLANNPKALCTVPFDPDLTQREKTKLQINNLTEPQFDFKVKGSNNEFTFTHPCNQNTLIPEFSDKNKQLKITKFCLKNGVLQTLICNFKFDENNIENPIISQQITIEFQNVSTSQQSKDEDSSVLNQG